MTADFIDPASVALSVDLGVVRYSTALEIPGEFAGSGDMNYMGVRAVGSPPSNRGSSEILYTAASEIFVPGQWFSSQSQTVHLQESGSTYAYSVASGLGGAAASAGDGSGALDTITEGDGILYSDDGLLLIDTAATESEDDDGDLGEVVITGTRPRTPEAGDGTNGTTTGGTNPGDGGSGGDSDTSENDCRDRNALAAAGEIKAEPDDNTKEHGSIVYKGADGTVRHSPPIQGGYMDIPVAAVEQWLAANGVAHSQVIGFVHNHPTYSYGGSDSAVSINSYPSSNDWGFADYMVSKGAGGAGGAGFALYIVSPDKELREFEYSDNAVYKNLSTTQKVNELGLPDELEDDGTSC